MQFAKYVRLCNSRAVDVRTASRFLFLVTVHRPCAARGEPYLPIVPVPSLDDDFMIILAKYIRTISFIFWSRACR